jgi:hypothetical protein
MKACGSVRVYQHSCLTPALDDSMHGHIHAPAPLHPGNELRAIIEKEGLWTPEPVLAPWTGAAPPTLAGNPVTIPPQPSRPFPRRYANCAVPAAWSLHIYTFKSLFPT